MSHTPAPWKMFYWRCDGQLVYNIKPVMRVIDGQIENKHDAQLIATAPELLDALIEAYEQLSHSLGPTNKTVLKARAAITKATEGSQLITRKLDCGYACGWAEPFGFVPEDGCPVHDQDSRSQ